MRVLWFANAPTTEISAHLFGTKLNNASWTESLHQKLSVTPGIEMGFAFRWNVKQPITEKINQTEYFVIPNEASLGEKIRNNLFCRIDSETRIAIYRDIIEKFRPDVIHIFGTENDFGVVQEFIDVPCVVQMQGIINNYIHYYFHAISPFVILTRSKLSRLIRGSSYYHSYIKFKKQAVRERKILKLTKNVSGFTGFDKRAAMVLGDDDMTYYHIPWLLRPPFYHNTWRLPEKKVFRIIAVINPNTYKGLETIYRTSELLNSKYPGQFEFVIAGISDSTDINQLIKTTLSRETIENSNLVFKGSLSADLLIAEMLESHALMHPSLCDTSPNSICEAMILGMPVVSTNVGGIPSIIDDEINGYLAQNMDHLSFAYILNDLREHPEKAIEVGARARETASARHKEEKILGDTIKMYKEISKTGGE